jgi:hypothetical protein
MAQAPSTSFPLTPSSTPNGVVVASGRCRHPYCGCPQGSFNSPQSSPENHTLLCISTNSRPGFQHALSDHESYPSVQGIGKKAIPISSRMLLNILINHYLMDQEQYTPMLSGPTYHFQRIIRSHFASRTSVQSIILLRPSGNTRHGTTPSGSYTSRYRNSGSFRFGAHPLRERLSSRTSYSVTLRTTCQTCTWYLSRGRAIF